MKQLKCICADQRGTDCDFCGGSGWISESTIIGNIPPINLPISSEKSKQSLYIPSNEILKQISIKNTYEERLRELFNDIKETKTDTNEATIIYLGNKLKKLYFEIRGLEKKAKKNKITLEKYNNALKESISLIRMYDSKFEKYRLLE